MNDDPLVSVDWLADRLSDPELIVVDATWFMPGDGRSGADAHRETRIPGAVFFDIDVVADHAIDLPHMLPTPEAFAEAAGAMGLSRDADIIVYDAQGIFSAPRVWWSLRVMGYPRVRVLDGGLKAWKVKGYPVESGQQAARAPVEVDPRFRPDLLRDLAAMRNHLKKGDSQVIDARAAARFRGESPEPRIGLRSGHMPGACNAPWAGLVADEGALKPSAELRSAFEAAGVDLEQPIVTTCGSGVSAALLALALAKLGRFDVAVYDGSWTEWASRDDTPVAVGVD